MLRLPAAEFESNVMDAHDLLEQQAIGFRHQSANVEQIQMKHPSIYVFFRILIMSITQKLSNIFHSVYEISVDK